MIKFLKLFPTFFVISAFTLAAFAGEANVIPNVIAAAEQTSKPEKIAPYQSRFGRSKPVIAVLGENAGTEVIDFVIPYGILSQSGAAEVLAVATQPGPLQLRPALRIEPQETIDSFDIRFPQGADYVIVPAVVKSDDPALHGWVIAQAGKGATIVSICDGALVVAKTGLFKGHRATGHWATQSMREHDFPDTQWLINTRYVADGKMVSTSGVTAAIPASLALVEAIAGAGRAATLARELGVNEWTNRHNSEQFHHSLGMYLTDAGNLLFSSHQEIGVPVSSGVDEIALALTVDAYSRTYRSKAYSLAPSTDRIRSRHGLILLPDRIQGGAHPPDRVLPEFDATPTAQVLDKTLADIAGAYGQSTAHYVAVELEYPQSLK